MNNVSKNRGQTFDDLYRNGADPWDVTSSNYERSKFAATLAVLPRNRRFRNVLDVGCSFGTLTAMIAQRSDHITGIDVSQVAIDRARKTHGDIAHFVTGELPSDWPKGRYDLILLSEVLYFLDTIEIVKVVDLVVRDLAPGGWCLVVNWTGASDLPLSGDEAADLFIGRRNPQFDQIEPTIRRENYRIDLLQKAVP